MRLRLLATFLLSLLSLCPAVVAAQDGAPASQAPLGQFAGLRVAVIPAQLWRADSIGWSRDTSWVALRSELDSILGATLRERGLGTRWAYADDVVRAARRNPLYTNDPTAIGVGRWRSAVPKSGDALPPLVADNLRGLTAVGDARYALIPVELRGAGDGAVLRLVLADTRTRTVTWAADVAAPPGAEMLSSLAQRIADLFVDP